MIISKKIIYPVFILIILVVIVYAFLPSETNSENDGNYQNVDYNKLDEIVFNVKTETITRGDLVQKILADGIVRANKELEITSNISGVISDINVFEGKHVGSNELLLELDNREYKIDLREAEERIIEAKVNYGFLVDDSPKELSKSEEQIAIEKELKELEIKYENSQLSEGEYLNKKEELEMKLIFTGAKREELILNVSGYNAARNQIERARLNFEYTNIKAPFAGVVGDFDLVVGQRINSGESLFKLFSTYTLNIEINILESELNKISIGNEVDIEIPAIPDEKFIGKVSRISPYIDIENRTSRVVISITNKDSKIKPGMFARVLIASKKYSNKILIPKQALLVRDKRNLVFTVEDSLAKWKYVDIGKKNEEFIEITKGVDVDEKVIVEGHFNLAHDSKVRIIN